MKPPAYNNSFSINADSGVLEVKTAVDREQCPSLVVGITVIIVLQFSMLIMSLHFIHKLVSESMLLLIVYNMVMLRGSWHQGFITHVI